MRNGGGTLALVVALLLWNATAASAQWIPPLGIPTPSFGIEESKTDSEYTHWVDNSVACSDASSGTSTSPRCTVPTSLAAGSVVQVRGGPYTGADFTWTFSGTQANPIFVRGPTSGTRPQFTARDVDVAGTFAIVENVAFTSNATLGFTGSADHVAVRHCEVGPHTSTGSIVFVSTGGNDLVIYDCEIHHNGPIPSTDDNHGINMDCGVDRVWIVDNNIHHNSGDAFQTGHSCRNIGGNTGSSNIYIGRNQLHEDEENAIDLKEFIGPIIVSQNTIHGYFDNPTTSNGEAIRINDEGEQGNLWIIFNLIYNSSYGINGGGSAANTRIIGNVFDNINTGAQTAIEGDSSPAPTFGMVSIYNTITTNVTNGITANEARSNIIAVTGTAIGASVSPCSHNHVQTGTIGASCTSGTSGDPLLVFSGGHVSGLQSGSPAIDTASGDHQAFTDLFNAFGVDIRKDRNGVARPQGAGWDRGAYEFTAGTPPNAPTNLRIQ